MKNRILVVEDELIVQMHLARLVRELGHEVCGTATTMEEALEAASAAPPDVALMDIHLANGTDGVETAGRLQERFGCAVVFITAYGDRATVERVAEVENAGYLVKPFSNASVHAAITSALGSRGRQEEARRRERSLASALVSVGDAVLVVDEDEAILFASPGAADLFERPAHEIGGQPLFDVLRTGAPEECEALRTAARRAVAEGLGRTFTRLDVLAGDGGTRPMDVQIEPVLAEDHAPGRMLVVLRRRDGEVDATRDEPAASEPRPFGVATRLLVYSHDTFGLGHLRRSLNIVRGLVTRFPDLSTLLITGSPAAHRFELPPGTDYLKLPAVRKVAPERYEARLLSMEDSSIHTFRSNLLLRAVRDYAPDMLLVDHSPIGMKGELRPALEWLRARGTCRLVLGLRDIVDEPADVVAAWKTQGVYDVLRDVYDHVVVYGARDMYDTVGEYRFPPEVAEKTRYVGYVADREVPDSAGEDLEYVGRPRVVVTTGGGDGGATEVIEPFLEMVRDNLERIDFHAEIVTGPFVDAEVGRRLHALAEGLPVRLQVFTTGMTRLFRDADVVVSTCGYNTMAELLAHAKRAVLVPRVLHRREQIIRALRMEELGLATCLPPDEVTPERLLEALERARAGPPVLEEARAAGRVTTDGADAFAAFCAELEVRSGSSRRHAQ